ncbi:MAG: helix-turn-helix transcriptional regulator [Parcubacteria group bacterium]|jgi:transcriptional regulator with XRE-family HTH domain
MQDISKKLGENLRKIRLKKKMSQGDIAKLLDADRGYISKIENGKKNLTLATTAKIAKALQVLVIDLLK